MALCVLHFPKYYYYPHYVLYKTCLSLNDEVQLVESSGYVRRKSANPSNQLDSLPAHHPISGWGCVLCPAPQRFSSAALRSSLSFAS